MILETLKENDNRSQVIVPGYTCYSVAAAIKRAGLKVKLVDFESGGFEYNNDKLAEATTSDTLAILLVYPFGLSANINKISKLAKEKGVFQIEDAAQAMGVITNGKYAGTIGDVGFYSLGKGKPITAMKGGLIATNDPAIAERLTRRINNLEHRSWKT